MKNLFLTQNGFSLVQGMIIAAVMAGSGLVANRMLSDQKSAQRGAETRDQIEDLHAYATATMQNRANCDATFTSQGLEGPLLGATATPIDVPAIRSYDNTTGTAQDVLIKHNGTLVLSGPTKNTYMNGNVIVKDMKVTYNSANGQAMMKITYERLNQSNMQARTKSGYGSKQIIKDIPLRVQRNPFAAGKPFESCYGIATAKTTDGSLEAGSDINKELCNQMTGVNSDGSHTGTAVFVWDEATSTCIPNAKCPDHLIYTGFDSTGRVQCKELSSLMNPGTMIGPTTGTCGPGKTVKFQSSADKKTVSVICY